MSDFSDRPFVAGTLIGLRSFGVDKLGRLHGPTYDSVFRPGVNVAECRKSDDPWFSAGSLRMYLHTVDPFAQSYSRGGFIPTRPGGYPSLHDAPRSWPKGKSRLSFISDNGSSQDLSGFLAADPVVDEPTLAEAAVEVVEAPKHTLAGLGCKCGFYAYFDGGNDLKKPERVTALIEGSGVCTVGDRGFRAEKARLVAIVVPGKKFPEGRFQLVLRNYPDVPVYATKSAAFEEYPLTMPETPGPESDGFWDRPVT